MKPSNGTGAVLMAYRSDTAAGRRHDSLQRLESLLLSVNPKLTPRQIHVCARALLGMTNLAISIELGISTSTVATLRRRAYSTLRISSLGELFALCLEHVVQVAVGLGGIADKSTAPRSLRNARSCVHSRDQAW